MTANTLGLTPIKLARHRGAEEEVPRLARDRAGHGRPTRRASRRGSDVAGHAVPRDEGRRRRLRPQRARSSGSRTRPSRASTSSSRPRTPRCGTRASARSSCERSQSGVKPGRHEDKLGQRASDTAPRRARGRARPRERRCSRRPGRASSSRWRRSTRRAPTSARSRWASCAAASTSASRTRKRAKDVRRAHRAAPARPGDARGDGDPHRGDEPARAQGGVEPRQGASATRSTSSCAKAFGADAAMQTRDRRGAGLRRLRVREGVPGREADARREDPPDLRGHGAGAAPRHRAATSSGKDDRARPRRARALRRSRVRPGARRACVVLGRYARATSLASRSDVVVDGGAPCHAIGGGLRVRRAAPARRRRARRGARASTGGRARRDRPPRRHARHLRHRARPLRHGAARRGASRRRSRDDGAIGGVSLRIDPGGGTPAVALLCLVAPIKLLSFPPADAGARGLAVEALWGTPSVAAQP